MAIRVSLNYLLLITNSSLVTTNDASGWEVILLQMQSSNGRPGVQFLLCTWALSLDSESAQVRMLGAVATASVLAW